MNETNERDVLRLIVKAFAIHVRELLRLLLLGRETEVRPIDIGHRIELFVQLAPVPVRQRGRLVVNDTELPNLLGR